MCMSLLRVTGKRHASEIGSLAVDLLKGLRTFEIPHLPQEQLKLRIGLHTGAYVDDVALHITRNNKQNVTD